MRVEVPQASESHKERLMGCGLGGEGSREVGEVGGWEDTKADKTKGTIKTPSTRPGPASGL